MDDSSEQLNVDDFLRSQSLQTLERDSLKEKERLAREKAEKLKEKCEALSLEKVKNDEAVKDLKEKNGDIARNLSDLNWMMDALKADYKKFLKEKSELAARIGALESELGADSEASSRLRTELQEKEKLIENLQFKLSETGAQLKRSSIEADEKPAKIEELVRAKSEAEKARVSQERILETKSRCEVDLAGLKKEMGILNEKNSKLMSDFKKKVKDLREKEKSLKKAVQELNSAKEEKQISIEKARTLVKERDSAEEKRVTAEEKRVAAERKSEESRLNEESTKIKYERALTEVKKTALMILDGKEVKLKQKKKKKKAEEALPYVSELESILKAFSEKQKAMEAMEGQLEALKQSMAEANEKSFWSSVSSALGWLTKFFRVR